MCLFSYKSNFYANACATGFAPFSFQIYMFSLIPRCKFFCHIKQENIYDSRFHLFFIHTDQYFACPFFCTLFDTKSAFDQDFFPFFMSPPIYY